MDECIQYTHQGVLVIAQELHRHLTCNSEDAFDSCDTETIDEVLSETERDAFWCFQSLALNLRCVMSCRT
jgi:hypothetical protein